MSQIGGVFSLGNNKTRIREIIAEIQTSVPTLTLVEDTINDTDNQILGFEDLSISLKEKFAKLLGEINPLNLTDTKITLYSVKDTYAFEIFKIEPPTFSEEKVFYLKDNKFETTDEGYVRIGKELKKEFVKSGCMNILEGKFIDNNYRKFIGLPGEEGRPFNDLSLYRQAFNLFFHYSSDGDILVNKYGHRKIFEDGTLSFHYNIGVPYLILLSRLESDFGMLITYIIGTKFYDRNGKVEFLIKTFVHDYKDKFIKTIINFNLNGNKKQKTEDYLLPENKDGFFENLNRSSEDIIKLIENELIIISQMISSYPTYLVNPYFSLFNLYIIKMINGAQFLNINEIFYNESRQEELDSTHQAVIFNYFSNSLEGSFQVINMDFDTLKDEYGGEIANCGETTMLNLLNFILIKPDFSTINLEYLPEPEVSDTTLRDRLIDYYTRNPNFESIKLNKVEINNLFQKISGIVYHRTDIEFVPTYRNTVELLKKLFAIEGTELLDLLNKFKFDEDKKTQIITPYVKNRDGITIGDIKFYLGSSHGRCEYGGIDSDTDLHSENNINIIGQTSPFNYHFIFDDHVLSKNILRSKESWSETLNLLSPDHEIHSLKNYENILDFISNVKSLPSFFYGFLTLFEKDKEKLTNFIRLYQKKNDEFKEYVLHKLNEHIPDIEQVDTYFTNFLYRNLKNYPVNIIYNYLMSLFDNYPIEELLFLQKSEFKKFFIPIFLQFGKESDLPKFWKIFNYNSRKLTLFIEKEITKNNISLGFINYVDIYNDKVLSKFKNIESLNKRNISKIIKLTANYNFINLMDFTDSSNHYDKFKLVFHDKSKAAFPPESFLKSHYNNFKDIYYQLNLKRVRESEIIPELIKKLKFDDSITTLDIKEELPPGSSNTNLLKRIIFNYSIFIAFKLNYPLSNYLNTYNFSFIKDVIKESNQPLSVVYEYIDYYLRKTRKPKDITYSSGIFSTFSKLKELIIPEKNIKLDFRILNEFFFKYFNELNKTKAKNYKEDINFYIAKYYFLTNIFGFNLGNSFIHVKEINKILNKENSLTENIIIRNEFLGNRIVNIKQKLKFQCFIISKMLNDDLDLIKGIRTEYLEYLTGLSISTIKDFSILDGKVSKEKKDELISERVTIESIQKESLKLHNLSKIKDYIHSSDRVNYFLESLTDVDINSQITTNKTKTPLNIINFYRVLDVNDKFGLDTSSPRITRSRGYGRGRGRGRGRGMI